MIVVVGSRHDQVAAHLVAAWNASLCTAEDLIGPGWAWHASGRPRTWRVAGVRVADDEISGVFVRRSRIHAEELTTIHPDDRAYVAAETHAFLCLVLTTTAARVCNPVVDAAFGDEALRFDRLLAAAMAHDVPMRSLRLRSDVRPYRQPTPVVVEVVGDQTFGDAPVRDQTAARTVAIALDLPWATFLFDRRHRLLTMSSSRAPSTVATAALGALLGGRR